MSTYTLKRLSTDYVDLSPIHIFRRRNYCAVTELIKAEDVNNIGITKINAETLCWTSIHPTSLEKVLYSFLDREIE